jgi:hypothetical protein
MVQNKRRRRRSKIFTIKDHDIEVVRSFNYLWTVINNSNDEMINKATILAANKAYSSLQTIFRAEQIHQNNNIIR